MSCFAGADFPGRASIVAIFQELKRRNVYKVAVACAVVAWLLVQTASILFPTAVLPQLRRSEA